MQKRRLLLLPCLLLASALFLAACGGSSSSGGEEGKIEESIEEAATSNDPSYCTKFATQQFLEQSGGVEGAAAVKECEKEAKSGEDQAKSVKIAEIEESGSEATADVTFKGGPLDSQAVEVVLIKEGDNWLLNELVGFTDLNQPALAASVGKEIKQSEVAELAPCTEEAIEELEQSEVEELLFSGSSVPLEELLKSCQ